MGKMSPLENWGPYSYASAAHPRAQACSHASAPLPLSTYRDGLATVLPIPPSPRFVWVGEYSSGMKMIVIKMN
jgi:hypothetical protein